MSKKLHFASIGHYSDIPVEDQLDENLSYSVDAPTGTEFDSIHDIADHIENMNAVDIGHELRMAASKNEASPSELLKLSKHIKVLPEDEKLDNHLHSMVENKDHFTQDDHRAIYNVLKTAPRKLVHKYGWVLQHNPVDMSKSTDSNFLTEDELKKNINDGFAFIGGRYMSNPHTLSTHYLHPNGDISVVKLKTKMPGESTFSSIFGKYDPAHEHEMLSRHQHASDTHEVRDYTSDSREMNQFAGTANTSADKNKLSRLWVDNKNIDNRAKRLSDSINSASPHNKPFNVYTGLSNSANPDKIETVDGHKEMHLGAFTSTSFDPVIAHQFSRDRSAKAIEFKNHFLGDILHINIPAGFKGGMYVGGNSKNDENEYLLDHGHKVKFPDSPKFFVPSNRQIVRMWQNGEVSGKEQHPHWNHIDEMNNLEEPNHSEHVKSIMPSVRMNAYRHGNTGVVSKVTSEQSYEPFAEHARMNVATNPNTSTETLKHIISNTKNSSVQYAVADHKNADEQIIHQIVDSTKIPELVQAQAIQHPNLSKETAIMAAGDENPKLRAAAIYSGKLEKSHIEDMLKNDTHPKVIHAAKFVLGHVNEEIDNLIDRVSSLLLK